MIIICILYSTHKQDSRGSEELSKCITAMLDESNDPGSRLHGVYYILGATAVDSNKMNEFTKIAEKRYEGHELKFKDYSEYRHEILNEISELKVRLYAVTVRKPLFRKWNSEEQRNVHRTALFRLMNKIAEEETAANIHMIIDENNKAKSGTIEYLTVTVANKRKKNITSEIKRSNGSFALQTNDFSLGAMNKKYNHGDSQYADRFPHISRSRIIIRKVRSIRKK